LLICGYIFTINFLNILISLSLGNVLFYP
jgi:hypothetical protein